MEGILNETSQTMHRHRREGSALQSECGVTKNLSRDVLHPAPVEMANSADDISKCGRCFEDGGGY